MTAAWEILTERIEKRLAALRISAQAGSVRSNRQKHAIRDIIRGQNKNPGAALIIDLAHGLLCSADYLLGLTEDPRGAPITDVDPMMLDALRRLPSSKRELAQHFLRTLAADDDKPPRSAPKAKTPTKRKTKSA